MAFYFCTRGNPADLTRDVMGDQASNSCSSTMEIDNPGFLKRSNSAPMIPQLNTSIPPGAVPYSGRTASGSSSPFSGMESRTRRFSASFSPRSGLNSPKILARVEQIRQEECTDILDREVAHENKLHSAMRISQSWEDLSIMADEDRRRAKNKDGGGIWDPLNLHVSSFSFTPCSPSPTRSGGFSRQCYSPGLFKLNLSPSPTRKTFATRRSLSPIALRPSSLGSIKRKFDLSDNEPPAKKTGGLLLVQSRLESSTSSLPSSSVSSVGTPESISSVDSPSSFSFTAPDSPSCDQPMRDVSKVDQNLA
ncbi:P2R1A-PPP2R2A-interacting phosphatase regulator 1 isoform X2 [Planococcus citri]|uniref:P2R1A-PPP2R2A-interacting phosphatase regulator 1 isoform X2 n=1 Tax=Planococcus citri TaxID=170843 RepID=UPI0031F96BCA